MKTEQEVRNAIANDLKTDYAQRLNRAMPEEEVQDLAVIIGKALGLIEDVRNKCKVCKHYFSRMDEEPCSSCENFSNWEEKVENKCSTCKYEDVHDNHCNLCRIKDFDQIIAYRHWEAKV